MVPHNNNASLTMTSTGFSTPTSPRAHPCPWPRWPGRCGTTAADRTGGISPYDLTYGGFEELPESIPNWRVNSATCVTCEAASVDSSTTRAASNTCHDAPRLVQRSTHPQRTAETGNRTQNTIMPQLKPKINPSRHREPEWLPQNWFNYGIGAPAPPGPINVPAGYSPTDNPFWDAAQ